MGSKQTRTVYDYNMSIDFGICYGPVDHVNQVFVKDKPMWCGRARDRQDVYVYQPELFGGDDAEGGPVGTVEFYPGTSDQVSSGELSSRFGRTPEKMPGYRNLCHLFFRGGRPNTDESDSFLNTLFGLWAFGVGQAPTTMGFRWTSNNPYLPSAKVSVTRLSRSLGDAHALIWPINGVDAGDGSIQNPPRLQQKGAFDEYYENELKPTVLHSDNGGTGDILDLLDYGYTQEMLDLGGFKFEAGYSIQSPDASKDWSYIRYWFYDENMFNLGSPRTELYATSGTITNEAEAPAGTRFVECRAWTTLNPDAEDPEEVFDVYGHMYAPSFTYTHCKANGDLGDLPDANPAHVLHEILVNPDWGKGEDPALINVASFQAAAETLYNEAFGISFIWRGQSEIEKVCQEILDHIKASMYQSPATGLWELNLWRDDYDINSLVELNPSNCNLENRKRRAWGETINEIVVSYTHPKNEKDATVSAHNLANIQVQGGVISETRNYHMVRNRFLAQRLADRDVRESGHPLFTATVKADRTFWNTKPGAVLRLNWPEDGLDQMVVRVQRVKYGDDKDRAITLEVVEDIFSLEQTEYSPPPESLYVDPNKVLPEAMSTELPLTIPAPTLVKAGYSISDIDAGYPGAAVGFITAHDTIVPNAVDIYAPRVLQTGETVASKVLTTVPSPQTALLSDWPAEVSSVLPGRSADLLTVGDPKPGVILMIGDSEALHELIMLDAKDSDTGDWSVIRGIYDTIPRDWASGTSLWKFPVGPARFDPNERASGETINYRFCMSNDQGRLPYHVAEDVAYTVTERPHLPLRPANTQIEGSGFGVYEISDPIDLPADITVTWANRNRGSEDTTAFRWLDGSTAPEAGQTVTLRVLDEAGDLVSEVTGLSGTSYTFTASTLSEVGKGFVEFWAEMGGDLSLMAARREFNILTEGYGLNYGNYYG